MTIYQRCPFCERVFAIGSTEHQPMTLHIGVVHTGERERTDERGSTVETTAK